MYPERRGRGGEKEEEEEEVSEGLICFIL